MKTVTMYQPTLSYRQRLLLVTVLNVMLPNPHTHEEVDTALLGSVLNKVPDATAEDIRRLHSYLLRAPEIEEPAR